VCGLDVLNMLNVVAVAWSIDHNHGPRLLGDQMTSIVELVRSLSTLHE
jgi:hypothetical protein